MVMPARGGAGHESLESAWDALSFRTGIISDLQEKRVESDDPELFVFASVLADTRPFSFQTASRFNAGAALSRDEARAKAIGEALERYCAGYYDKSRLILATYAELGPELAVSPDRLALFSAAQYLRPGFPYRRPTESTRLAWIEGFSLTRRRPVLVPACLVFVPYDPLRRGEESTLAPSVSSGLACGPSLDQATLSGIFEVVERDAFCTTWFNRLRLPAVEVSPRSERLHRVLRERFLPSGARYHLTATTLDVPIPSFVCVCLSDSAYGPLATVGAACHLDPEIALLKAVVESAHAKLWLKQIIRTRPDWRPAPDFANVVTFEDHVLAYRFPDLQAELGFLTDPGRPVVASHNIPVRSTDDPRRDVETCVRLLREQELEVVRVDLTTEDVEELGFHVVKVLVPGMQEINGRHDLPFLGGRRLYDVPLALGHVPQRRTEAQLNPAAHPFP